MGRSLTFSDIMLLHNLIQQHITMNKVVNIFLIKVHLYSFTYFG